MPVKKVQSMIYFATAIFHLCFVGEYRGSPLILTRTSPILSIPLHFPSFFQFISFPHDMIQFSPSGTEDTRLRVWSLAYDISEQPHNCQSKSSTHKSNQFRDKSNNGLLIAQMSIRRVVSITARKFRILYNRTNAAYSVLRNLYNCYGWRMSFST